MLRKLFTHSFLYSIAPQIPKIVTLALMPVITQNVSAYDYAIYGVVTSYLFFASALKDLGFSVVFVNAFYKHPGRWKFLWRIFFGHLTIWSFFFSFITATLLYVALPPEGLDYYWQIFFLVIVPVIIFENTNMIGNYYYRFSEKPLFVATASIITGIATIITTYYCVVNLKLGYRSWFIATFVSSFVLFCFYAYSVFFKLKIIPILKWRTRFIKPYLRVSLPMIPHNYSTYLLNSSDRVVMDWYKVDLMKIGNYNIAYTFGNYFEALGEAMGLAVTPFYSKMYSSGKLEALKDARNLTFFLMSCFLTIGFLISLWLKEVFTLLIRNDELSTAYNVGIFIIMGYVYRPMYWSAGINLSISEKTSILWKISFVAGMLNVILNLIFIPLYGIMAAAISTLISLIYMGFAGFYLKGYKKLQQSNHYPRLWILLILTLTFLAYQLRDTNIYIKMFITGLVVVGMLFLFFKKVGIIKAIKI